MADEGCKRPRLGGINECWGKNRYAEVLVQRGIGTAEWCERRKGRW